MFSNRAFLACLLAAFLAPFFAPALHAQNPDEERVTTVAERFLRDYFTKGYTKYFLESDLVTSAAKSALKRMEAVAKKKNPELGLDHDPVAQAQDHADAYRLENVIVEEDKATAEAVAEGFPKIPLRLVRNKGAWLVDGAGEVNPARR